MKKINKILVTGIAESIGSHKVTTLRSKRKQKIEVHHSDLSIFSPCLEALDQTIFSGENLLKIDKILHKFSKQIGKLFHAVRALFYHPSNWDLRTDRGDKVNKILMS